MYYEMLKIIHKINFERTPEEYFEITPGGIPERMPENESIKESQQTSQDWFEMKLFFFQEYFHRPLGIPKRIHGAIPEGRIPKEFLNFLKEFLNESSKHP